MKIIMHINESERWPIVIENLKNLLQSEQPIEVIEVLANGNAVRGLAQNADLSLARDLENLSSLKVDFKACDNAFKKYNPNGNCPLPFVDLVSNGVIELAKCQDKGFSYIKP